jgi:hypothetical protein
MHIFELCDEIRKRPGLLLDGDKSIKRLRSFLAGYEAGVAYQTGGDSSVLKLTGAEDLRSFNSWVAKQLGIAEATSGWCSMILGHAGSDEKAFGEFFQLLDEYRNGHGNFVAK